MPKNKFTIINGVLHFQVGRDFVSVPPELQKDLEDSATDFFNEAAMQPPARQDVPFFAYGLFKPGQLGFDSLRQHTKQVSIDERMKGVLYERDGVPLFVANESQDEVKGALIFFTPEGALRAYQTIADLEPERQYKWETRKTRSGIEANVLVSKSINGAHHIEERDWDGRKDPHFGRALDLVESVMKSQRLEMGSVERLMELQMAYMLLWTAIERYTSLRYHLRKKVMAKIRHMADEPGFRDALVSHVKGEREVFSTDAGKPARLSAQQPRESLLYYYQVRSNVTHRGKALMTDAVLLSECISELLAIFRETIERAFQECAFTTGPTRS